MITSLHADNYRCFVNFDWQPSRLAVLAGNNGGGKSTIGLLLIALRDFIAGDGSTEELFPANDLTVWETRSDQLIEFNYVLGDLEFTYRLEIEHSRSRRENRVTHEGLNCNGKTLFSSDLGEAQLFRDDGSEGPKITLDWNRSGLATLAQRDSDDNRLLKRFVAEFSKTLVIRPVPAMMSRYATGFAKLPDRDVTNFVAWLRSLNETDPSAFAAYHTRLTEAIPGYQKLQFASGADDAMRSLLLTFAEDRDDGMGRTRTGLPFDSWLSDGQKQIFAIYAAIGFADQHPVVFLDEPQAYLSLYELSAWTGALIDASDRMQCLVATHNRSLIDFLGPEHGHYVYREPLGPSRVSRKLFADESELTPGEQLATQWIARSQLEGADG